MISAKDRKAAQEAQEQAQNMGLMLLFIFNPAFDHYFVEMKAPDTQEVMGQSMGSTAEEAFLSCLIDARNRLNLLGIQKYEFAETKPLISLTDRPDSSLSMGTDPILAP